MKPKGWETIYKIQGEVQSEALQVVKEAVLIFKERGYQEVMDLGCGTVMKERYFDSFIVCKDMLVPQ